MPKVAQYNRQGLASSAVGTPGVDQSNAIVANAAESALGTAGSVALAGQRSAMAGTQNAMQAAQQVHAASQELQTQAHATDAFFDNKTISAMSNVFSDVGVELRQAQARNEAAKKAQQKMFDDDAIDQFTTRFELTASDMRMNMQANGAANPKAVPDDYDAEILRVADMVRKDNPDMNATVAAGFMKKVNDIRVRDRGVLNTWVRNETTALAKVQAGQTMADYANSGGQLFGRVDELVARLGLVDSDKNRGYLYRSMGADDAEKLIKSTNGTMINNFMESIINETPTKVQQLLQSGNFDKWLDADDKQKLMEHSDKAVVAQEKDVEQELKAQAVSQKLDNNLALGYALNDKDNPKSIITARLALQQRLNEINKMPEADRKYLLPEVNDLVGDIRSLDGMLDKIKNDDERAANKADREARRALAETEHAENKAWRDEQRKRTTASQAAQDAQKTPEAIDAMENWQYQYDKATPSGKVKYSPQAVAEVEAAIDQTRNAAKNGYMDPKKASTALGHLRSRMDALKQSKATGKEVEPSPADRFWQWATGQAPQKTQTILNPENDKGKKVVINNTFNKHVQEGIDRFTAKFGRAPKDWEISRIKAAVSTAQQNGEL